MSAIVPSKPIKWMYVVARATTPVLALPLRPELRFYCDPERIKAALDSLCPQGTMHEIEYQQRRLALIDNPIIQAVGKGLANLNQLKTAMGIGLCTDVDSVIFSKPSRHSFFNGGI